MKAFSPGLSDSIANVSAEAPPCPHCDSSSHIAGGLCVGCLLQAGLHPDDECEPETLATAFAEIIFPDKQWRLGNYEILEEIGRGGMGVIYRARQRHSRRIVAVKRVLSYHADSRETLARFRREAQAAASLDHPNILPIYEVSESEDGLPFFSMKFAPGGTLQQVGPALRDDPRQCVALVAKIARAVQYAHSRGILHRDLKPGNILLDGRGEPLVSDFGLAKWLDTTSDLTRTLTIFGTPGYIAPEQASHSAADLKPTADIYSLGAILFDLLAGRPPFLGSHALSVIRQAAESPAPKLRSLSKLADRDLETICARCLEREASARYRSAHDLAEDLERWLEGRTIVARPVSPHIKAWRWSKRNRKLAFSIAAAVILGTAGLFQAINANRLSSIVQTAAIAQHSVVVLPFDDLDEVSIASAQSQSVTKTFRAALGAAKNITVRRLEPQTTEFDPWQPEDWKRLGREANARIVLSGSVRLHEGRQRIVLHGIDTTTGTTVRTWIHRVDTSGALTFLADDIGQLLSLTKFDEPKSVGETSDSEARSFYEKGKELLFRFNLADQYRAIESLRKAVEKDPNYALAHALLASACQLRSVTNPEFEWETESQSAATAALRLTPMLPEAHRAYAGHLQHQGHFRASLDPYLTAYELNPSSGRAAAIVGYIYDVLGRPDLAIAWLEKGMRRENRPVYADNLGDAWTSLGEYEKAEAAYNIAAVFRPDLPVGPLGLVRLRLFRGDYDGARRDCEQVRQKYKENPQPVTMAALIEFFARNLGEAEKRYREALSLNQVGDVNFPGSVRFLSAIAFCKKGADRETGSAEALLEKARALDEVDAQNAPDNPRALYSLSATYAALDEREEALKILANAVEVGWIDHRSMTLDPRFDSIRSTKRFTDILHNLLLKIEKMKRSQPGPQQQLANLNAQPQ